MEAKAPQRELKGCPKAAQRPPKGSKMDPTGSTHASVLASMGPKASRRTPWRQKGTKKLPKVRQKVQFSHQKLDAEAVPKTSKSRCKKGAKMKAKTFLNPYRPLLAFEQPPRFSVRACPCMSKMKPKKSPQHSKKHDRETQRKIHRTPSPKSFPKVCQKMQFGRPLWIKNIAPQRPSFAQT